MNEVEENLVAVMFEINMISNVNGWWVNFGAIRHICGDKNSFSEYKQILDWEKLYMENSSTSKVEGKGNAMLKFTFEILVNLANVLDVFEIRKNLLSDPMLSM